MYKTFPRQLSFWLSLTTIALVGSGLSAQAETIGADGTQASAQLSVNPKQTDMPLSVENRAPKQETVNSKPVPVPGTVTTSANALVPRWAESASEKPVPRSNIDPTLAETSPSPDSTPASPVTPATPTPDTASKFPDVGTDYWAYPFIQGLAAKNVIIGFPDGSFRPEQPVNRAEFAAMLQKAFRSNPVRQLGPSGFSDVPADYWAASAIRTAYESGFMSGYPNNLFLPNQEIPKVQAIDSLVQGLGLTPQGFATNVVNTYYTDAAQIPSYAVNNVAAATQANLVVNYPDVRVLTPQAPLTRAQAAAHLYQTLVRLGQLQPLASNVAAASYIVGGSPQVGQTTPKTPAAQTTAARIRLTNDYSYLGVAVNFGLDGNYALGSTNFTVFSKLRLLKSLPISLRPAAVIADNTNVLIPVTYDFSIPSIRIFGKSLPITPYLGGGIIIPTGRGDVGPLISAGLDYRLGRKLTATLGLNVGFISGDNTQIGLLLGIGYNFGFGGI